MRPRLLVLAFSLILLPVIASADWQPDGIPVCTMTNDQFRSAIVSDGSGGAIIAWSDMRDGPYMDIYAQRMDALGNPQWGVNGVALCKAAYNQDYCVMVSDGAGGAILAWGDHRNFPNRNDIGLQRVNALGVPQWTPDGIAVCIDPGRPGGEFSVVADGVGGAIVAWTDTRRRSFTDIYAQRVDAFGHLRWISSGVALCTAPDLQVFPQIVSDDAQGGIVTWFDLRSGTSYDVYAQRVSAFGTTRWAFDGVALCTGSQLLTPFQFEPYIAADGTGGAIVVWADGRRRREQYDIYTQRVNASGVSLWTANGIAVAACEGYQFFPVVASDGGGGAIVAWGERRNELFHNVYAQRVSASGAPAWAAGGIALSNKTDRVTVMDLRMVSDGAGGGIVTWMLRWPTGENDIDLYAQRVDNSGTPQWAAGGVTVCAAREQQMELEIAPDGAKGAIVSWTDNRKSDLDIYAQRIPLIQSFDAITQTGAVELHWEVRSDVAIDSYEILRRESSPTRTTVVAQGAFSADMNSFLDTTVLPGKRYDYVLTLQTRGEVVAVSPIATATMPTIEASVGQNHPNPFNPATTIDVTIPERSELVVAIYDARGARVATLNAGIQDAGTHRVEWNGTDDAGRGVGSGVYFYRLEGAGAVASKKMVLLK